VPQPPTSPPVNTAPPSIHQDYTCFRLHCTPTPYTYFCEAGSWSGRDPVTPYEYSWQQLYQSNLRAGEYWRTEATGDVFVPHSRVAVLDTPTGIFRCLVTASNAHGSATAASASEALEVAPQLPPGISLPEPVDITVTGIEVTQGVQSRYCEGECKGSLPERSDLNNLHTPGEAPYAGVTMVAGNPIVVRVFAHLQERGGPSLANPTASLEALDAEGRRATLFTSASTSPTQLIGLQCGECVSLGERAKPNASFNFLVPGYDTFHRSLSFRATVTPPSGPGMAHQCGGCRDNEFTLQGVPFITTPAVRVEPVPLTVGGAQTKKSASEVFGDAQELIPVTLQVDAYLPPTPVDSNGVKPTNEVGVAAVQQMASDDHFGGNEYPIGVFFRGEGELKNGLTTGTLYGGDDLASIVQDDRTLTSVAHEMGHGFGLLHADTGSHCEEGCKGLHPDSTPDCGGNSNGQRGELWPPDNEGRLQSVGLDRRNWNTAVAGSLPSTYVEGYEHDGTETENVVRGARYYDFMSYCPSGGVIESLDWLSERNWNRLLEFHPVPQALPASRPRARAAAGEPLRVIATVSPAGAVSIFDVAPGAQIAGAPTPGSPYRIELRDAGGSVLASVVPDTTTIHVDGAGEGQPTLLTATLPFAPGAAAVVVSAGGRVLARRNRPARPPTAKLLSPRGGSVGRARTTLVRWSAHDAEGNRLTAAVDYSPDGGRSWKAVAENVTARVARIPSHFLSASANARIRVRINDSFNVTTLVSRRLRAIGARPVVRILGARPGERVLATATLLLRGVAFDDTGRALSGGRLRWYAGSRLLGRGDALTQRGLTPGATTIRLLATDSHGRTTQATLRLRVKAVAATYIVFDAPLIVAHRARSVRIVVASTARATFTIAHRRYAVTSRPRTITLALPRGPAFFRFPCTLASPGGAVRGAYVGVRGR
jgi:hypothetical protein